MIRSFLAPSLALSMVLGATACSASDSDSSNLSETTARDAGEAGSTSGGAAATSTASASAAVAVAGKPKLAPPADAAAVGRARGAAEAAGMTQVSIIEPQSFRVLDGSDHVATLVSGKGWVTDAVNPGCFLALIQEDQVRLVPTIGSGEWEAETCLGVKALGLLSGTDTVRIGVIYDAASPNAAVTEPMVLTWRRANASLDIDTALSTRASETGALSIKELRGLAE